MSAMTKPLKCPHCAKAIDFGKLTKQNPPDSVHSIDGVRAGLILKDIPALIAKHLDNPEVNSTGRDYTITLSNLEQTKAITLLFLIEADDDADPPPSSYRRLKGKNGETAGFIVSA